MRLKVKPMDALSLASRTSHATASDAPAPAATPFTAAITGLRHARSASTAWIPARTYPSKVSASPRATRSLITSTSAPVQKPRPAPVITTTRTSASADARSTARRRSSRIAPAKAFSRSGRFSVIHATPSSAR